MKSLNDIVQEVTHTHTAIGIDEHGKFDIQDNDSMEVFQMWKKTFVGHVRLGVITDVDGWNFNYTPVRKTRTVTPLN